MVVIAFKGEKDAETETCDSCSGYEGGGSNQEMQLLKRDVCIQKVAKTYTKKIALFL